jgi:hypothetical protein
VPGTPVVEEPPAGVLQQSPANIAKLPELNLLILVVANENKIAARKIHIRIAPMPKAMRPPVSPNIAPLPVNDLLPDPTATEVNIACYEAF